MANNDADLPFLICSKATSGLKNVMKDSRFKTILRVGWFGLNGPLRQCFSLYRAVSPNRGTKKRKKR